MKPAFIKLKDNYPGQDEVAQEVLFREIGWDDLIGKPAFDNTCAIRVSLALIKCGLQLKGRMPINKGPFKGKLIEPGQARLAHMLKSKALLGAPETYPAAQAEQIIGSRQGLIAFWRIPSYLDGNGGHIDILLPSAGAKVCGSGCYWNAAEVWFWPIPV